MTQAQREILREADQFCQNILGCTFLEATGKKLTNEIAGTQIRNYRQMLLEPR